MRKVYTEAKVRVILWVEDDEKVGDLLADVFAELGGVEDAQLISYEITDSK